MKFAANFAFLVQCPKCGVPHRVVVAPDMGSARAIEVEFDQIDLERLASAVWVDPTLNNAIKRSLIDRLFSIQMADRGRTESRSLIPTEPVTLKRTPHWTSLMAEREILPQSEVHNRTHVEQIKTELNKKVPPKRKP